MLVLSLVDQYDESGGDCDVRITTPSGETVWLRVTDIGRRRGRTEVRLGFDAPPGVEILRGSLVRDGGRPRR